MRGSNFSAVLSDLRWVYACCLASIFILATSPTTLLAQGDATTSAPTVRDGQRDFDFDIGAWKTHVSRLQHPLSGSTGWTEYEGTTVVSKVWNGRANLAELEADGRGGHLEVLSLRLYNRNLPMGASTPPVAGRARSAFLRLGSSRTAAASSSIPSCSTDETSWCAMSGQTSRRTPAALNSLSPPMAVRHGK